MKVQKETLLSRSFNHSVKYQESSIGSIPSAAELWAPGILPTTIAFSRDVFSLAQQKNDDEDLAIL